MFVPEIADRFRATLGVLRSVDGSECVRFHRFPVPNDCCVSLLLKNAGERTPAAQILETLEALHINVKAVMHLRSKRRNHEPAKDRPLTPHVIVSVARNPDVRKYFLSPISAACE
jgi:hypothetical protein